MLRLTNRATPRFAGLGVPVSWPWGDKHGSYSRKSTHGARRSPGRTESDARAAAPTDRPTELIEATDRAATGTDRPKEASQTKDSAPGSSLGQPAGQPAPPSPAQPEQTNSRQRLSSMPTIYMHVRPVGAVTTFFPRGENYSAETTAFCDVAVGRGAGLPPLS